MHGHTGRSLRRRWLSKTVDTNEVAKSAVELCRPSVFASQPDRVPKRVRRAGVPWKRHAGKGGALLKDCNADAAIRNHDRRLAFERDLLRGCQSGCREPEHCEPEAEHRNHYPLQSGVGTDRPQGRRVTYLRVTGDRRAELRDSTKIEPPGSSIPIPRRFQMKLSRRNLLKAAVGIAGA